MTSDIPVFIIQASYLPIHGYLSLSVCLLGTVFNMVNMLVLTHKDMRMNPINIILTGIAVADCLVMVEYVPSNIHMYLLDYQLREKEEKVSFTKNSYTPRNYFSFLIPGQFSSCSTPTSAS